MGSGNPRTDAALAAPAAKRRQWKRAGIFLTLGVSGCNLAPDYKPTHLAFPDQWEGNGSIAYGHPNDAAMRPDWWKSLGDPVLDQLEDKALRTNADLQAAAEAFTQSRDVAAQVAAHLYPQVSSDAGGAKYKSSTHRLWRGGTTKGPLYMSSEEYEGTASWEPDFWDLLRNKTRIAKQQSQQRAADFALARLSLEAEVASDYVALRGLDAQDAIYRDSIRYYQTAVQITNMRLTGAIGAGMDVTRAQNQLFATQAAETDLQAQRQMLEHAIATLTNTAPAGFHIAPVQKLAFNDVTPPASLPSTLLERRPDIASAERQMAEANLAIGVSRAAFYPQMTFSAETGFMDNGFDLASLSSSMYQFGASAVLPLFQGGIRRAELQKSWAQYRQSEDQYRSTVLSAFQEVEDGLTGMNLLKTEAKQEHDAATAAGRTQIMSMQLYTGGLTNYLDVVVAQQAALTARIGEARAQTRQVQAVVELIRALGGGWQNSMLPQEKQIRPFSPLQYDGLHHPKPVNGIGTRTDPTSADLSGNTTR